MLTNAETLAYVQRKEQIEKELTTEVVPMDRSAYQREVLVHELRKILTVLESDSRARKQSEERKKSIETVAQQMELGKISIDPNQFSSLFQQINVSSGGISGVRTSKPGIGTNPMQDALDHHTAPPENKITPEEWSF